MSRPGAERRRAALAVLLVFSSATVAAETRSFDDHADLSPEQARSGFEFLTPESQALQRDSFANPGFLWVDKGKAFFNEASGDASCDSCHGEGGPRRLAGAAARYPAFDRESGRLLNLEGRINRCRERHQHLPALAYETEQLLALTAYVAHLSSGAPYAVSIDGAARPSFENGRRYFFQRKGQLNLACNQCHDDHWGGMLRGDRISQGHGNAYPAYRLEWQGLGSLHRRIRDCDLGVRAEPHALGSDVYVGLELYLAWRAKGLLVESPGIRR